MDRGDCSVCLSALDLPIGKATPPHRLHFHSAHKDGNLSPSTRRSLGALLPIQWSYRTSTRQGHPDATKLNEGEQQDGKVATAEEAEALERPTNPRIRTQLVMRSIRARKGLGTMKTTRGASTASAYKALPKEVMAV